MNKPTLTNSELLDIGINKIVLYKVARSVDTWQSQNTSYTSVVTQCKDYNTHAVVYLSNKNHFIIECQEVLDDILQYHKSSDSIPQFIFEWILLNPDKKLTKNILYKLIVQENKKFKRTL